MPHAGLGDNDVLAPGTRYWLALDAEGVPVGTIGAEYGADAVLVRSAAVHTRARSQGVGAALLTRALAEAQRMGYQRAYLFSTDAGAYWLRQGFREVPVPELVAALPARHRCCTTRRKAGCPPKSPGGATWPTRANSLRFKRLQGIARATVRTVHMHHMHNL